jgi:hypothetical protein
MNPLIQFRTAILAIGVLLIATAGPTSANLIVNGDFETGDFTGWTTTAAVTGSDFGVTLLPLAHDTHGAFFSANGADFDSISQTFATTPGAFYTLTFFYQVVADQGAVANNEFRVLFNGASPDMINIPPLFPQSDVNPGFGTFTFTHLQATDFTTTLEFQGRNATLGGFDYLDDVSVTAEPCPQPQGYWKNNPNAWPVDSLMLGSQTYNKTELLTILKTATGGDASLILADQLIAAKLNGANLANEPDPVPDTITDADSLLSGFSGKLPYKVKPSSPNGQAMVNDAATLESYNNGALTIGCAP